MISQSLNEELISDSVTPHKRRTRAWRDEEMVGLGDWRFCYSVAYNANLKPYMSLIRLPGGRNILPGDLYTLLPGAKISLPDKLRTHSDYIC